MVSYDHCSVFTHDYYCFVAFSYSLPLSLPLSKHNREPNTMGDKRRIKGRMGNHPNNTRQIEINGLPLWVYTQNNGLTMEPPNHAYIFRARYHSTHMHTRTHHWCGYDERKMKQELCVWLFLLLMLMFFQAYLSRSFWQSSYIPTLLFLPLLGRNSQENKIYTLYSFFCWARIWSAAIRPLLYCSFVQTVKI